MELSIGPGPRSVRLTALLIAEEKTARPEAWCCDSVAGGGPCTTDCRCEGYMLRHFQSSKQHICDKLGCEEAFDTIDEVITHERTH